MTENEPGNEQKPRVDERCIFVHIFPKFMHNYKVSELERHALDLNPSSLTILKSSSSPLVPGLQGH